MAAAIDDIRESSAPVSARERIVPLDVLRGFALLGILSMNVRFFSMVEAAYLLPTVYGDLSGANYAVFYATALLADSKMMALFSMLFGAGVVLMTRRQEQSGHSPWRLHLRRMLVLLGFGLVHAYVFWAGDILATYAQTVELASFLFWRAGGLMLVGMALFANGFLSARKPPLFYGLVGLLGLLAGLPAIALGIHLCEESGWDARYVLLVGSQFNYWGSLPTALAWASMVMLACQTPRLSFATGPLAAVGRMALTNYLLQTLICTTLFYGHGLGWFGQVQRVGQIQIVVVIWALQLAMSPLWLRCFRFGPAEWLWRSLTYGKRQPFLIG